MKSILFVVVQFSLLAAIIIYGDIDLAVQRVLISIGFLLGLWAVLTMRLSVNIFPDVREKQSLYTSGPYKYIRHPMYTSVLLVALAFIVGRLDVVSLILWLLLLIDLLLKLHYEEQLLLKKFNGYKGYMSETDRLIPYVY